MAIPSGSGTEVLKRVTADSNSGWNEIFSGSANHIYTIITIIAQANATGGTIGLRVNDGAEDIYILNSHPLAAYETFIWNDKFVLYEDDDLDIYSSGADVDFYVTYIDQDWT